MKLKGIFLFLIIWLERNTTAHVITVLMCVLLWLSQVEVCSPRIKQLLSLCCDAFSREQLCNLECLILLRLNFRLAAPTLAFFLDYFISRELSRYTPRAEETILEGENKPLCWKASEEQLFSIKRYKCLAGKVCELSLADYAFNKYQPSVIVQSAINLAKDLLRRQSSVEHSVRDEKSHGSDHCALIQQCTQQLQLLVSLNQESIQDLITLWTSTVTSSPGLLYSLFFKYEGWICYYILCW